MSTKTTFKRIALVAVAALALGTVTTVSANAVNAGTAAAPWTITAAQSEGGTTAARTATQISGAANYVELTADNDFETASALTVLKVTGSTVIYTATGSNSTAGVVNTAATEVTYSDDQILNNVVRISTAVAGTITAKYYVRTTVNGVPTDTLMQSVTITVSDVKTWSDRYSTAVIAGTSIGSSSGVAGSGETDILAPKGALTGPFYARASVSVAFMDSTNTALSTPTGKFPTVRATIEGPGNLAWESSVGRDVTIVTPVQAPTLTIFADGWAGTSTIKIYVDGVLWKTKTMKFYGTVATLSATQELFVAPVAGGAHGCGAADATCTGDTVAETPAAVIAATDALGTPVPYLSISASSSDTTVFASSTTSAMSKTTGTGTYNANVVALPVGTSGKSSAITFRTLLSDGVTYVSAAPLTYAIGGATTAIKFTVANGDRVGQKGTFTISKTDASGNKSYDAEHTVAFKSNISLTSSIFPASSNTQSSNSSTQTIINGTKTWDFFNPLVEGSVTFDVTVGGLLTGTVTFSTSSVSQDALDAAAEAIDAANAATDAANAAAEAADAATAAAQDAADAVAALSTQVSEMIAALKKQITALTNLVIKIQKKVKA